MSKKALLMILDGWGIGDQGKDDVIFNTPTPYWDSLLATYPHYSYRQAAKTSGCLTDKWVTLKSDTSISGPDVSFTRIW